jgi:hypothetical protein
MEQKSLDISTASVEALKVAAYDILMQIQNYQNALNAVQVELQKRVEGSKEEPKKK